MDSIEILDRLIGFPTVSRDSNLALIEYVRDFLASCGVGSKLYGDESGRKANLYAVVGPQGSAAAYCSGHTDVVPVDGQQWTSPSFSD